MSGKNHNNLAYRRIAFARWGRKCDICGSVDNLTVHHINGDPKKNTPFNLQVLCSNCHEKKHIEEKKGSHNTRKVKE